jgi:uncharacterized membrane protein
MTRRPPDQIPAGNGAPHPVDLREGLQRLAKDDPTAQTWHLGARLRNYFLTGLVIVGPVTITVYIIWWLINEVDAWIKPFVPRVYNPDTYLPFPVPGIGLLFAIVVLTLVGALAANLLGRTIVSYGELMLGRMPIVRNVYQALKQIFESIVTATAPNSSNFQKVGLIEFPSKGLWSLVFVTGETTGELKVVAPGGENDLLTVWVPTGIVPPTGFICFLPRKDVSLLKMSVEDAAKIIISGGMVMPDYEARLRGFAAKSGAGGLVAGTPRAVVEAAEHAVRAENLTSKPRKS